MTGKKITTEMLEALPKIEQRCKFSKLERRVLTALRLGSWHPKNHHWKWITPAQTQEVMDRLVHAGFARRISTGVYHALSIPTIVEANAEAKRAAGELLVPERGLSNTRRNRRWLALVRAFDRHGVHGQEQCEALAWVAVNTWEATS